jgi:hypothetical protein
MQINQNRTTTNIQDISVAYNTIQRSQTRLSHATAGCYDSLITQSACSFDCTLHNGVGEVAALAR